MTLFTLLILAGAIEGAIAYHLTATFIDEVLK